MPRAAAAAAAAVGGEGRAEAAAPGGANAAAGEARARAAAAAAQRRRDAFVMVGGAKRQGGRGRSLGADVRQGCTTLFPRRRAGPARSFPSPLRGPASLHRACVSLRPVPSDSLAATASEALHTTT